MLPSHRRNNINSSSRSPKVDRLGSEVACRCRQSLTVGSLRGTCVASPAISATHSRPASLQVHTECSRGTGHDMDSPPPLWRSFHENGSSRSSTLPSPYKSDNRGQLRKAVSMLCKEMIRPPPHVRTRLEVWAEIEKRMQSLVRLEQIWGTSNTVSSLNNLNLVNLGSARVGTTRSTLTGVSGEEGERRAFYEALRDGFVLCQLMNKLCPANAVRPDPREQGNKNVTRFLAACASHGLQNQDLFWADDLIDPTSESLARVAHTIITLIQLVETPTPSHIKPAADTHLDALSLSENSAASPMASLEMSNNDRMKSPTTIESTIARATVEERPATATKEVTAAAMTPSMSSLLFQDVTALPGPYMKGSMGYASSVPQPLSTPSSPHSTTASPMQKEHSPPVRLPSIYLDTPGEGESAAALTRPARLDTGRFAAVRVGDKRSFGMNGSRGDANEEDTTTLTGEGETAEEKQEEKGGRGVILEVRREKAISVPQIFKPPPPPPPLVESLLRTQPPKRTRVQKNMNNGGISAWVRSAASPSPSTMSSRGSPLTPTTAPRTSANIAITTTSGDSATDALSLSSSPSSTLPRSQLRRGRGHEHTSAEFSRVSSIAAESTRAPIGNISFLRSSLPFGTSQSNEYHPLKLQHQRPSAGNTAAMSANVTTRVSNNMQFGYPSSGGHSSVGRTEGEGERFGTIRPVAMDSTSDSIMNSAVVENDEMEDGHGSVISRLHLVPLPKTLAKDRERRPSVVLAQHSGHAVDLMRVAEESNESPLSGDGIQEEGRDGEVRKGCRKEEEEKTKERDGKGKGRSSSPRRVALHTAESPDNVSELFPMYNRSLTLSILDPQELSPSSIPARTSSFRASYDIAGSSSMSRSASPPRKLTDMGGRIGNEPSSLASRRPAQFRYHNLDPSTRASSGTLSMSPGATSGLLPKANLDSDLGSPSSAGNPTTAKVMVVRRTSANKDSLPALGLPYHHTGSSLSIRMRNNQDATPGSNASDRSGNEGMVCGETIRDLNGRLCGDLMVGEDKKGKGSGVGAGWRATPVPFPQLATRDHPATPLSPGNTSTSTNASNNSANNKQLGPPRRRFQSELGSGCTTRSKPRPNSCDELGTRPWRMRFESMVSLGRANSAMASTNDLMARNSMYGNAVKQMLTVKEKGKPSTHFQLGNCIGKGQFGSVYRALNLSTGQMVAVKRIRLEGLKEDEISTLMKEVDLVKSLSHPGIVKCEGMVRDEDTLSIVLEYVENGSLAHTLKAFGKLNEKLVASYVTKILEGLHYLHQSEVVHCDLKAANILTTKNGNVKLSDFGVSLNLRAMERQTQNDIAGTPNWMAPEVIELKGTSTKSDIWSLGCTVIELFTGRPPYADISNSMAVMFRIVEDNGPPIPERCSEMLQDFLKQCFHKDPSQRPSAEVLCEHPWLKNNWDALQNLRPQDSIPFLRRVSVDMQKSDMVRHLARVDLIDSPTGSEPLCSGDASGSPPLPSPVGRRTSNISIGPAAIDPEHPSGDHNFVKTTFGKPVICRVCLENVKKAAVLCAKCSLISHSKCAPNAPPTCDLRSQLLLYAHYAEQGSPHGLRVNPPLECSEIPRASFAILDAPHPTHHTPRTSLDTLASQPSRQLSPSHPSPSTAFKLKTVFKRSWSSLTNDSNVTSGPDPPKDIVSVDRPSDLHFDERIPLPRKRPTGMLQKQLKERPRSYTSNSTGLGGLRSAATTTESLNSSGATEARRLSQLSSTGIAGASSSQECDGTIIPKEQVKSRQMSISVKVPAVSKSAATPGHETTNDMAELNMSSSIVPGPSSRDLFLRKRNSKNSSDHGNCIIQ